LAAATAEEREARLEGLRADQRERLAAETAEEREARLEGLRADQQEPNISMLHNYMLISRPDSRCVLFVWYSVPRVHFGS